MEGFKRVGDKDSVIQVGIRRHENNLFLGPLLSLKKNGKGIKYFKANKTFIEGEFVKN